MSAGIRITVAIAPTIDGLPDPSQSKESHLNITADTLARATDEQLADYILGVTMHGSEKLYEQGGEDIVRMVRGTVPPHEGG